jgi:ribose transport system permease protein
MKLRAMSSSFFSDGATGSILAVVVLAGGLMLVTPRFGSADNFDVLAYGTANLALVAFAQMVVIAAGGLDLSVGAMGGLAAIIVGGLMEIFHVPPVLAIAVGLAVGAGGGAATGWLVVRTGLSPFMVTLATGSVFTGVNLGLTSGRPFYYLPESFKAIGILKLGGIPLLMLFTLLVGFLLYLLFRNTGLGRQMLALGANPRAAELAGVPVARTRVLVHTLSGMLAAAAGIMLTIRLGVAQPSIGNDWLLNSFAAPIIGGTLLSGGSLSVPGAVFGALLLLLIGNGLIQLGIDSYWTQFFSGLIILAAGGIDRIRALNANRRELRAKRKLALAASGGEAP